LTRGVIVKLHRAMAQAVSRRTFTAQGRVWAQVCQRGTVVDKVALGQILLRVLRFYHASIIPWRLFTFLFMSISIWWDCVWSEATTGPAVYPQGESDEEVNLGDSDKDVNRGEVTDNDAEVECLYWDGLFSDGHKGQDLIGRITMQVVANKVRCL
jgi:hypothetical protein